MNPGKGVSRKDSSWKCPVCGKQFVQRGLWHSCGVIPLESHFRGRERSLELFNAFCSAIEKEGGPFRLSIAKTRIGIITRITFAAVMPRKKSLRAHILLLRKIRSKRFVRIDHLPPYWVHVFEIQDEADIDEQLRAWLGEAFRVGAGIR